MHFFGPRFRSRSLNFTLVGLLSVMIALISSRAQADIVYNFEGQNFTTLGGSPFIPDGSGLVFGFSDFVTAQATFAQIGDSVAKEITLSTTGNPGFSITLDNTLATDVDEFVWSGAEITGWNLSFVQNVVGDPLFVERIETSSVLGDAVSFDFNNATTFDGAFTFSAGSWSTVPEPSSSCLFGLGVLLFAARRKRRLG